MTHATESFLDNIVHKYPFLYNESPSGIYTLLSGSTIVWSKLDFNDSELNSTSGVRPACSWYGSRLNTTVYGVNETNTIPFKPTVIGKRGDDTSRNSEVEIVGKIAHICHYCSIAILALILIEVRYVQQITKPKLYCIHVETDRFAYCAYFSVAMLTCAHTALR